MSRMILEVMVRGRVQGVGYRAWIASQAGACGLEGWVRNRRHGPPLARVDSVTSETAGEDELNLRRAGETFSVLPTV